MYLTTDTYKEFVNLKRAYCGSEEMVESKIACKIISYTGEDYPINCWKCSKNRNREQMIFVYIYNKIKKEH